MFFIFFFQAEDGIRDLYVTGVQTCALPISKATVNAARIQLPSRFIEFRRCSGIIQTRNLPRLRMFLGRSEEHTSELQSRRDLVCRLLLEKKKNKNRNRTMNLMKKD